MKSANRNQSSCGGPVSQRDPTGQYCRGKWIIKTSICAIARRAIDGCNPWIIKDLIIIHCQQIK